MSPIEEYGENWADDYDTRYAERDDLAAVVTFVDGVARRRSVLELGVGTGRLAIPLRAAGYRVHGVDASAAMLDHLAAKPEAAGITTVLGDMASIRLDERFGVVLIAFSTLFLLADGETQARCVHNAADHLAPGGALIVETFVMDANRWHGNRSVSVQQHDDGSATVTVGALDQSEQVIETLTFDVRGREADVRRNRLRYALPAEIDLMARLAGLSPAGRYADLAGRPYGPGAGNVVSVYRA